MYKLVVKRFLRFHLGTLIGIGFFCISLFFYRSYENRPIWGLWSYPFFAVIILSMLLFLVMLFNVWRIHKKTHHREGSVHLEVLIFELAISFWGIAYFISALDDFTNSGRITELNFFGSSVPVAVCLEWVSLVLLSIAALLFVSSLLKKKWANIMLMLGTIIVTMLLIEGFIRFKAVVAPTTQGFPTYSSALWGRYYAKYNREGFRDVEHSITKEPKTRRLLIVGDSFAFGWGIKSIEHRFGSQIGKKLTTSTKEQWEVINFSREDTHTLEHIDLLKQALVYMPDVVILLYVFNDIDYLYPVVPRKSPSTFSLSAVLFKNFYIFQEIYIRFYYTKYRHSRKEENRFDPYMDNSLLSLHLKDISTFVKLAKPGGTFVGVVPFDIRLTLGDKFRNRYKNFIDAAEASKIPIWSLENAFDNFQYSQLVVNNLDSHPNELANRIAAEEIAKRLLEEIYTITPSNSLIK